MNRRSLLPATFTLGLFLSACASQQAAVSPVSTFDQASQGYVEFYCASCVTGWGVYEIQNGRAKRVLNLAMSRKPQDLLHNPVRMRRVGIAYPPGEVDFLIRLPHSMFSTQHISERIHVSVTQGVIIPVQIDAHKQTEITMEWNAVMGAACQRTSGRCPAFTARTFARSRGYDSLRIIGEIKAYPQSSGHRGGRVWRGYWADNTDRCPGIYCWKPAGFPRN